MVELLSGMLVKTIKSSKAGLNWAGKLKFVKMLIV